MKKYCMQKDGAQKDPTLKSKIKYINGQIESGNKLLKKYFADDLLLQIDCWRNDRNILIHALLKQDLTEQSVVNIACTGEILTKELRNRSTKFSRAVERNNCLIKVN